jgi:hypothetical protein
LAGTKKFCHRIKKFTAYKDVALVATDINPLAVGLYQKTCLRNRSWFLARPVPIIGMPLKKLSPKII